jgi:hypothetical protein
LSRDNCLPVRKDGTLQAVKWQRAADLSGVVDQPIRLRFHLTRGRLYSFWVSPDPSGASHGYVAAGGPGFSEPIDTVGTACSHWPSNKRTPVAVLADQRLRLGKIGVATQQNPPEAALAAEPHRLVEVGRGSFLGGMVATAVDHEQHLGGVGQRGDQGMVTVVPAPTPPERAINPVPSDQAIGLATSTDLAWSAGTGAVSHNVYFGPMYPPASRGNRAGTTLDPGSLSPNTT